MEQLDINLLRVFVGRRRNTELYVYGDFTYYRDNRTIGILRCSCQAPNGCPARLWINEENELILINHHICEARPFGLQTFQMRAEIALLARERLNLSPGQIWRELVPRYVEKKKKNSTCQPFFLLFPSPLPLEV